MGALVVGTRDQLRIQTIAKLSKGTLRSKEALVLLGVSERTPRRWLRAPQKAKDAWSASTALSKIA